MKIVICDDDYDFACQFEKYIIKELEKYNIEQFDIALCTNKFNDIDCHSDIYFIDVHLDDESGFELSKKISYENKDAILIFVSSNAENVYSSFEFSPFDFIRKDKLNKILGRKIHRVIQKYNEINKVYYYEYAGCKVEIRLADIVMIEKYRNDLNIITKNHVYKERKKISDILMDLDASFYQISRSMIINFKHVIKAEDDCFVFENGEKVYFRKKHKQDALNMFYNYLNNS